MAEVLVELERWDDAIPVIRDYLELVPGDFSWRVSLFQALEKTGDVEGALEILGQMRAAKPCDEPTLSALIRIHQGSRQFAKMINIMKGASQTCPDLLSNINNYAWALATLPDPALRDGGKAVSVIRRAIIKMGTRDPAYLDTLAGALAETGDFDEAIRVQIEAIEILKANAASEDFVAIFAAHLDHFRAHLPLRDPAVE